MGILRNFIEKKEYWLNPDNWLTKYSDQQCILLKKTLLDTIIKTKNVGDLSFDILNDIDLLSCLLNTHSIKNTLLINKLTYSKILKNNEFVLHILKTGVVDETICQVLLTKFKLFKNDQDLAKQILSERKDYFYFNYFKKLLKNQDFTLSLFEDKKFNNAFSLISLPQHKQISQLLIERFSYPSNVTQENHIQFNDSVLNDVNFINKILRKPEGHSLYGFLPKDMKNNVSVCLTMLKYHPEYDVENSSVKTLKNFKICAKFWFYYNDFIEQIKFFGSVFDNDDSLFEAFKCINVSKKISRFNSLSLNYHTMVHFIINKSHHSALFKKLLETEKGKYLLSLPGDSSSNIRIIDNWIHEELVIVLDKLKLYNKMSELKQLNKEKVVKI